MMNVYAKKVVNKVKAIIAKDPINDVSTDGGIDDAADKSFNDIDQINSTVH